MFAIELLMERLKDVKILATIRKRWKKNLSVYLSPRIFKPSYNPETGLLASMLACGGTQKSLRPLAFMAFRESKQSLQKNCITQWKKTCDHYSWNLGKIKTEKTKLFQENKCRKTKWTLLPGYLLLLRQSTPKPIQGLFVKLIIWMSSLAKKTCQGESDQRIFQNFRTFPNICTCLIDT